MIVIDELMRDRLLANQNHWLLRIVSSCKHEFGIDNTSKSGSSRL